MKERGWLVYLCAGLSISVAAAISGSVAMIGLASQAVGWIAVWFGLRAGSRQQAGDDRLAGKPWRLFAYAGAAFLAAGVVRAIHGEIAGVERPFPSPADAIALSGHVLLIWGGNLLGQLRSPDRNRSAIIDGAIIAAGLQTLVWAWLQWSYMTDIHVQPSDRAINCIYAFMTMVLLATIGRLAVGPGARTLSFRLLAGAVFLVFLQDVLVTVETVGGPSLLLGRALAPPIFVLFGAAAGHPARLRIAEAAVRFEERLSWRRAGVLIAALLINPVVIAAQLIMGTKPTLVVVAVSSTVLTLLVLARFVLLSRSQERAVEVQRIQRDANAELATASSRQAMHRAALKAASRLGVGADGLRVSICEPSDGRLTVVDSVGADADGALGAIVDPDAAPLTLAMGIQALQPVTVDAVGAIDLRPDASLASRTRTGSILVTPLASQAGLIGALVVTTTRPVSAVLRQSLETLGSTVALALESATLTEEMLRRRSERRFRALVDNSSDIVLVVDDRREITYASPAAQRLLGLSETLLVGSHPARWVHPNDWPALASLIDGEDGRTASPRVAEVEVRISHINGSHRWFEMRTKDVRHEPEIRGVVITAREITDRKASEQALAASESRFRSLVQNSTDLVAVVDLRGVVTYVSPAVTAILGVTPDEVIGTTAVNILNAAGREQFLAKYPELMRATPDLDRLMERRIELPIAHRSGEIRILEVEVNDLRHEPSVSGIVLNARDITDRKALERDLRYQATHDALTGLANRTMFTQEAASALRAAAPHGVTVGALLLDLDDFQTVNDSLGHAIGDVLLQRVAERFQRLLSPDQLAARLGGDEYAVLVLDADDPHRGVVAMADELLAGIAEPFLIEGREIQVTGSIGIAVADGHDGDAEVLLRNADVAMYQAKAAGKARVAVFADHHHRSLVERMELKSDLSKAIDDGQLRCVYQPIVALQTGRVTGTEALVRWEHPTRGLMGPDTFIPLAESTGLVIDLGRWILREACRQLRGWQLELPAAASFTVSVNLSVRQLEYDGIVDDVRSAIDDAGIDPSTLTLEITETSLMQDTELARTRLVELRDLGVSIAVDDFGTGYSSLQYVQSFPIDILKIDRTFVSGLNAETGVAVVQSMIELAQRLGVHTVAEGIENVAEVERLRTLGADLGQGFLFSRPVPAHEIDALLSLDPSGIPSLLAT